MSQIDPEVLKDERENTDNSLGAERQKATESLKITHSKSQNQTDRIVEDERVIADQKTADFRLNHDDTREAGVKEDAAQNLLAKERRRADSATELERSRVDAAISKERATANTLVSNILDSEREATDRNLLFERDTTDIHLNDASSLLHSEESEHAKTKISLTSRDEFLAIVSHDLRNPIGAARSYAEILLEETDFVNFKPEIKRYLKAIKRNTDISLRLISDLLDMEKISHGKLQMQKSKCNLTEVIQNSLETYQVEASEKNIKLSANTTGRLEANCDPDRLMQVLGNLIGNALKFTPENGTINVNGQQTENEIQISVSDSGPGIPDAKKEQIFERFAQLKTANRDGLGLGLYISKMLIAGHQGRIWVESKVGTGSSFNFAIPN